jgi:peptide/nickel transport system ATP-binding protein
VTLLSNTGRALAIYKQWIVSRSIFAERSSGWWESGCGKSTLGKVNAPHTGPAVITSGELWFDGRNLLTLSDNEMREVRGAEIGMVFQDPMTSLNPVQRINDHLTETIQTHEPEVSDKAARARSEELVERLGIRRERLDDYPHQMSGGMRQRVMISLALALRAKLVIADEPTTSLDVSVEPSSSTC